MSADIGTTDTRPLLVKVTSGATYQDVRADLKARGLFDAAFRVFANGAIMVRPNGAKEAVLRHGGIVDDILRSGDYVRCMCDADIG
jgi:hypothetical protein